VMLRTTITARLSVLALLLLAPAAVAADGPPSEVLAPSGKLKVGLYTGTPTSIVQASDGPRGVGYDLGAALAKKLGVPYEPVVFAKNAEVLDAVKTGKVDAAFTNASASRAKDMDFGPVYLEGDLGYLVPKGSKIAVSADVDAKGIRVGVTAGSSSDAELSHDLKNAEIVRVPAITMVPDMFATGKIDVFATNKATLFEIAEQAAGATVLDGHWGLERHAVAIPKGRDRGRAFIENFTEEAKASGLVADAIKRSGLRAAATAPPK
jgi:polar amino acid transport system substrate-binding protein